MNAEQKKMLHALIQICETNEGNASDEFEAMLWENMRQGLEYIKNGGKYE